MRMGPEIQRDSAHLLAPQSLRKTLQTLRWQTSPEF